MRKGIPVIGIIVTVFLALFFMTDVRNRAQIGEVNVGKTYSVQTINTENRTYLFVWDNENEKCKIIRGDAGQDSFELLHAVAGNKIYYQYSYVKQNDTYYGVGCYNPVSEQKSVLSEWKAGNTQWIAFGIYPDNSKLSYAVWEKSGEQIKEYEADLESENFKWELCRSVGIETDAPVFGFYDESHGLNVGTFQNELYHFSVGSSHPQKSTKIINHDCPSEISEIAKVKSVLLFILIGVIEHAVFMVLFVGLLCILLLGASHKHSLLVRMYCVAELVLLGVLMIGTAFFLDRNKTHFFRLQEQKATDRMEEFSLICEEAKEPLRVLFQNEVTEQNFYEIMLVNASDGTVVTATGISDNVNIGLSFDETIPDFIRNFKKSDSIGYMPVLYKGTRTLALTYYDGGICKENEVVFGIVNYPETRELYESESKEIIRFAYLLLAAASLIISVTLILYQKRWKRFVDTAHSAAFDKTGYSIPAKEGNGMDVMWGSLQEMSKNVEKLDYEKQRSTHAFSRFIPVNLAGLFERENLAEVPAGFLSYKNGTMVQISMESLRNLGNHDYLKCVNKGIGCLREKLDRYNAVIIGTEPDNLKAKCFFEDGVDEAVSFAIEMSMVYMRDELLGSKQKTMLINCSEYCCGVAGVEDMVVPFIYSKEDELLCAYDENLRKAGVGIVLTDAVLSRLSKSTYSVRYIGYISDPASGRSLKLYECLDAYTETERKIVINTLPFFEKALNLFYSDDFYLARNTFNKVLQMNPKDQIARWYLFNCEYYLNKTDNTEISYALYNNPMIEQQYQK